MKKTKRNFLKLITLGVASFPFIRGVRGNYKPKIVIIGGGFGGGSCARYLERFSNFFDILLIEKKNTYYTCPFSNYVLGGFRTIEQNIFDYKNFALRKTKLLNANVHFINPEKNKIILDNNDSINYDWLVISPGIDFKWNTIEGYNQKVNAKFPHCWNGKDVDILNKQIDSLDNNSVILISIPAYPYRCPPAPYERASMIAYKLKKKNLKYKIFLLDNKNSFTKQKLFLAAWNKFYPNCIEWISKNNGGEVVEFNQNKKEIYTKSAGKFKGNLINIIPEQKAGQLLQSSNLVFNDWVEIDPISFSHKNFSNIHVLGDSINAGDMPKSAFSANSQAKICAENLKNKILEKDMVNPTFLNTCYSLASSQHGFSTSSWYRVSSKNSKIVSLGSTETRVGMDKKIYKEEMLHSLGWYENIVNEVFG